MVKFSRKLICVSNVFSWYVCRRDEIIILKRHNHISFAILWHFFWLDTTCIINICNYSKALWHNSDMLLASIMAVCANAYTGSLKFSLKYINMHSFMFCLRTSRWVMPISYGQSVLLASINMVMSGVGITKSWREFLMLSFH